MCPGREAAEGPRLSGQQLRARKGFLLGVPQSRCRRMSRQRHGRSKDGVPRAGRGAQPWREGISCGLECQAQTPLSPVRLRAGSGVVLPGREPWAGGRGEGAVGGEQEPQLRL